MTIKRLFDVSISFCALIVLSPLLAAIALWIKADSSGPVIFRQVRVGVGGRHFRIMKFRTMRIDAESVGPQLTVGRDARITRAGKYLRAYKLDELPQLLNVLKGDMSLVGPRPEVPRYVEHYPDDLKKVVLSIKPGITDLASIRFRNENAMLANSSDPERTYLHEIMPVKLRLYAEYVRNRNFWTDLMIIVRTVGVMLNRH